METGSKAALLLSGGSTPGPIYTALSRQKLPWRDVNIGLVDERWVDESDKGSNEALIRRTLLRYEAVSANFISMKTPHITASDAQNDVDRHYKDLITPHSLAVLGMGPDGHICSWFPDSGGLSRAVDPENSHAVQAIMAKPSAVTGDYLERMTLTLSALLTCRSLLLLITGKEKQQVFERAIETHTPDLPISHLLRHLKQQGQPNRLTILHGS